MPSTWKLVAMSMLEGGWGQRTFPTQYATKIVAAVQLFFVAPATLLIPRLIIRLTTGPKKPMMVYPATGVAARCDQVDLQIIAQPAMTGKQQRISRMMRMLGIRLDSQPVSKMKMNTTPPRGNCRRIESRVVHPNVETIKGPKPETAPFTV